MKKGILFILLSISVVLILAFKEINNRNMQEVGRDWLECIEKYKSKWGEECRDCINYKGYKRDYSQTYKVFLRNTCAESVEVKCCVQEDSKGWRCFAVKSLTEKDTLVAYACNGTGKYLFWARQAGDKEIIFPTDEEVNEMYPD